jgi:pyruvate dehydrogenase E1 component alpha subunit
MTDQAGEDLAREDPAVLREYYRQMVLIRAFELRAAEMYTRARIGGYCHLNLGEEATVAGLTAALRPEDYLFATYREHGYALARGADPGQVMAELFGRADGLSHGRGGSMHLFDTERNLLGGYGIVGGQIPLATGAAFALAYKGGPAPDAPAVMCLLGDATTNIGAFHESLNLAALWHLPILYVIVNNQLGMGTRSRRRSPSRSCGSAAAPTGCPGSGWTATTCSPSATPPAPPSTGPGHSTSPRCWRRSATGCAATR